VWVELGPREGVRVMLCGVVGRSCVKEEASEAIRREGRGSR
jgi:hypothetical protein